MNVVLEAGKYICSIRFHDMFYLSKRKYICKLKQLNCVYFKKSKVPPSGLGPLLLFISQYSQMIYLQRFTRISKDRTIK